MNWRVPAHPYEADGDLTVADILTVAARALGSRVVWLGIGMALGFAVACGLSDVVHAADDPAASCRADAPWGLPDVAAGVTGMILCRPGSYVLQHDDDAREARWVAYRLTGEHSLGCLDRASFPFYRDPDLPNGAKPSDYRKSGYDLGHLAPAQDAAWNKTVMHDFFSVANIAPQLPGLNRQEWERLEETVRAWAWSVGTVEVYVGPILANVPKKTVGSDDVAVPTAFWKVIVDPKAPAVLAFIMPQHAEPKGDLTPWQVAVADVERQAGLKLPLPEGVSRLTKPALWPADLSGWKAAHKRACHR